MPLILLFPFGCMAERLWIQDRGVNGGDGRNLCAIIKQGHDSPEVAQQKQARLMAEAAPASETISDAPPPPSVVNKALTGRIREIPISRNGK